MWAISQSTLPHSGGAILSPTWALCPKLHPFFLTSNAATLAQPARGTLPWAPHRGQAGARRPEGGLGAVLGAVSTPTPRLPKTANWHRPTPPCPACEGGEGFKSAHNPAPELRHPTNHIDFRAGLGEVFLLMNFSFCRAQSSAENLPKRKTRVGGV